MQPVLNDAAGNIVQMPRDGQTLSLIYGANGRLQQAAKDGKIAGNYTCDANGLRAQKITAANVRQFVYDGEARLLGEYLPARSIQQEFVWQSGALVATLDVSSQGATVHYVGTDFVGTPRSVVDTKGHPAWSWDFSGEAFGDSRPLGSYSLAMRFPGQYHDAESGLNYNVHRDYSSGEGRYMESDPIGLMGGISTCAYTNNSPLKRYDPLGNVDWHGSVISVAGIVGMGTGFFKFDLISDCINGKKVHAKVFAPSVAGGVGMTWTGSAGAVDLHDYTETPNSDIFNGGFGLLGGGITVIGAGRSCARIRVGHACSSGFMACRPVAIGVDVSAGIFIGASVVTSSKSVDCDDCKK